jgi:hypothetical protein
MQIRGTKHFITTCSHTRIAIGCQTHTVAEWQSGFKAIGKDRGYTADQIAEYALIIEFVASWVKAKFGKQEPVKASPIRNAKGQFAQRAS